MKIPQKKIPQKFFVVLSFLLLYSLGAISAQEVDVSNVPDKQLEGHEIKELIEGKTINGVTLNGNVHLFFEKNNHIIGYNKGWSDSGSWSVEGKNLCIKWRRWEDSCRFLFIEKGKIKLEGAGLTFIQN